MNEYTPPPAPALAPPPPAPPALPALPIEPASEPARGDGMNEYSPAPAPELAPPPPALPALPALPIEPASESSAREPPALPRPGEASGGDGAGKTPSSIARTDWRDAACPISTG